MTHTFTQSGLGSAPFEVVTPNKHSTTFFCEHCGTTLKNQNFVRSSDGVVSVVGIDCLKKTGDAGLIEGVKRLARQKVMAEREAKIKAEREAQLAMERKMLGGKTISELELEHEKTVDALVSELVCQLKETVAYPILEQSNFGTSMIHTAICRDTFTPRMIEVMTDIIAKHVSGGSRKNSKAYKAALPKAESHVDQFLALPAKCANAIAEFESKKFELLANAA